MSNVSAWAPSSALLCTIRLEHGHGSVVCDFTGLYSYNLQSGNSSFSVPSVDANFTLLSC